MTITVSRVRAQSLQAVSSPASARCPASLPQRVRVSARENKTFLLRESNPASSQAQRSLAAWHPSARRGWRTAWITSNYNRVETPSRSRPWGHAMRTLCII